MPSGTTTSSTTPCRRSRPSSSMNGGGRRAPSPPRRAGWEQPPESKPWYHRTGRLEFYRDEKEFLEYGETLPVWREPVDSTFYEPNVILAKPHPAILPLGPEAYGLRREDQSVEVRQGGHAVKARWGLKATKHPLSARDPRFRFIFLSPKDRP